MRSCKKLLPYRSELQTKVVWFYFRFLWTLHIVFAFFLVLLNMDWHAGGSPRGYYRETSDLERLLSNVAIHDLISLYFISFLIMYLIYFDIYFMRFHNVAFGSNCVVHSKDAVMAEIEEEPVSETKHLGISPEGLSTGQGWMQLPLSCHSPQSCVIPCSSGRTFWPRAAFMSEHQHVARNGIT